MALCSQTQAAQDAGTDSALYLGTGARAVAMGRAGVTDTDSAFAADWNPGGLGFAPIANIGLQHAILFGDAALESLGVVYPGMDWGTAAATLNRLAIGAIDGRDENNLPLGGFSFVEQAVLLAYGLNVYGPFSVGAGVRAHQLQINGLSSLAPGADAGILFRQPLSLGMLQAVSAGLACRNALSPVLKLKDDRDPLFSVYRAGLELALDIVPDLPDCLLVRVDAEKPERSDLRLHMGAEYALYDWISFRGGWDNEYLSAGLGVRYAGIQLDYAASFPVLGLRHLLTLSYAIGPSVTELRSKREEEAARKRQEIVANMKNKIVDDYKTQAKTLTQQKKYEEAEKLWEKILDWEPENQDAKSQLALVQKEILRQDNARDLQDANENMSKKNYIDVMVVCQQILERDPENAIAKTLYTEAEKSAQQLGNFSYTANTQMLERIRSEYQLGLQAYTQRKFPEAVKHWERVIETTPLQKQVYRYLENARNRMLKEQQAAAQAPVVKVVEESKKQKLYKDAVALSRSGNLKDAVRNWESLVKENPEDQDAKQNLEKTRQNLIEIQKKGVSW